MINRNSKEVVKKQTSWHCLNWAMTYCAILTGTVIPTKRTSTEASSGVRSNSRSPQLHPHLKIKFRIENLPDQTTLFANFELLLGLLEFAGSGGSYLRNPKVRVLPPLQRIESWETTDDTITEPQNQEANPRPISSASLPLSPRNPDELGKQHSPLVPFMPSFIQQILSAYYVPSACSGLETQQ